jgi:hypothetical protein
MDTETGYTQDIRDLIYLLICAINETAPDHKRVGKMNLDAVYRLAAFHSVASMVAFALESVNRLPDAFDQAKKKAIRKRALFDIERGKFFSCFDEEGIWYVPLKGIVLGPYYPKYGMREMADNDILCDGKRMQDVKRIMEDQGFMCEHFGDGNHDVYIKSFTTFEMHRSLFSKEDFSAFDEYYQDIEEKLLSVSEKTFERRFRREDLYIYLLAHEYKHYTKGGTGLRSLLDTYVLLHRDSEHFDWTYINLELEKLSLTDFERMNREIAKKAFSGADLREDDTKRLMYYVNSGAQGTDEHVWKNRLSSNYRLKNDNTKAKRKYLHDRVFISGTKLKSNYPFINRHKVLLPALYVYRLSKAVITKPKKVWKELKTVHQFDSEEKDN